MNPSPCRALGGRGESYLRNLTSHYSIMGNFATPQAPQIVPCFLSSEIIRKVIVSWNRNSTAQRPLLLVFSHQLSFVICQVFVRFLLSFLEGENCRADISGNCCSICQEGFIGIVKEDTGNKKPTMHQLFCRSPDGLLTRKAEGYSSSHTQGTILTWN